MVSIQYQANQFERERQKRLNYIVPRLYDLYYFHTPATISKFGHYGTPALIHPRAPLCIMSSTYHSWVALPPSSQARGICKANHPWLIPNAKCGI